MPLLHRLCTLLAAVGLATAADAVWIEGEAAQASGVTPAIEARGRKEFLSDGTWLQVVVDGAKLKELPEAGGTLKWTATTPAGEQQIWARIGYEFARSAFAWRVDGGAWTEVKSDQLTTDLMELDTWCEVAWLQLGKVTLTEGEHTIEVQLTRRVNEKGEAQRILFAVDALCIAPTFRPNGRFKPGEEWRDASDLKVAIRPFALPEPGADGARTVLPLKGYWQIARDDEQLPGPDVAQPIAALPEAPLWRPIEVPSDKNTARPDLVFAHRLWYRTFIDVPAGHAGRSFHLVFPENNLNTTVWVNGQYCGFDKNPFARIQIDVSKAMKPGRNEVMVGIRDAWYGYSTNPKEPMKLRRKFNLPLSFSHQGFQDLAYPLWNHFQSGILATPSLVVGGPAYVADAFIQPSVAKRELKVDITVANPGAAAAGELRWEAIDAAGNVAKAFAPVALTLAAGESRSLSVNGAWAEARLWWPDEPNLYRLRTTVVLGGTPVDVSEREFGFREWTIDGKDFVLNGVPWHGWADTFTAATPEQWIETYRATNQRMMRLWGTRWMGMTTDETLAFMDRQGVPVRRSGIFDGEAIGYFAIENDPDLKAADGPIKMDLMRNWRDQVVAQVKGERNHPSVLIWSIENEWLYINCINLYGGLMDRFEAEVVATAKAVKAVDPTRPSMNDGGGAHKDNAMEVAGDHYVYGGAPQYPALAYEMNAKGGGRGRWEWDGKRPRFLGEDFFANGINPFDYAYFGGEEAFQGKAATRRAAGIMFRMLTEGYRWAGYGAWHFWMSQHEANDQYNSNAPVAVFCKQWNWTFAPGQSVARSLKVFNDTRFADPITVAWTLTIDGKEIAKDSRTVTVAPGSAQELPATLVMPGGVQDRAEGEWVLTCAHRGKEVFRDVKAVSVLAAPVAPALMVKKSIGAVCVYDPQGGVAKAVSALGITAMLVKSLDEVPEANRVLLIGKDALDQTTCGDPRLRAWAAAGRTVIVLEQRQPLRYAGLGAVMDIQQNAGRTAFMENAAHPAFAGLKQKDFFTWGDDQIVYRDAYAKPTAGATSLVQCHERLACSALAEVPAGKGILLVCQLPVAEQAADNAVARRLLVNLLAYGLGYKQEIRTVALSVTAGGPLAVVLGETQVQAATVANPVAALAAGKLAVIEATPANLASLAAATAKVEAFTKAGGWLILSGLTPEGLADYNKVVGIEHLIRPFRAERVAFPASRHWLTAGLTTGDVVMQSGKRVNNFSSDVYLASDVFSYVVDYDDIAPFATFPDPKHFGYDDGGVNDHNPLNMVNGFVSSDGWQMIFSIPLDRSPHRFDLSWPRAEQITELEWTGNAFYHTVTQVRLTPDGDEAATAAVDTAPNNETQTFAVNLKAAKTVTIDCAKWQADGRANVIGIDNIRLKAKRSPAFYATVKPLLNIGALMAYERGAGGIVLCNVLYQANEPVPENRAKKRAILAALLRNLKAPFGGAQSVIAGAGLAYEPIDIGKQATAYRNQQGWFGDKAFTFAELPTGRQIFAGVAYQIYEFPTSPVPTAVMLGGNGVPGNLPQEVKGIPVNRKADALFFLHAARLDARRNDKERKEGRRFEMAKYVVHYADGQTAEVPVIAEIDVDDYRTKEPRPLPGATLAWTKPYDGTGFHTAAYAKQWDNPRPDVAIQSVDLAYGKDRRGVPVLLALTAAVAK